MQPSFALKTALTLEPSKHFYLSSDLVRAERCTVVWQVLSFLDAVTSSSLLKLVRGMVAPTAAPKAQKKKQQDTKAEYMDDDGEDPAETSAAATGSMNTNECCIVIKNLAELFQHFGIRDQPDTVRAVIETLAAVTRQCSAGAVPIRQTDPQVYAAAYVLLLLLMTAASALLQRMWFKLASRH